MTDIIEFLRKEGVSSDLLEGVSAFRAEYPAAGEKQEGRVPLTDILYYGKKVWEEALAALLAGKNLLLCGPKATGKNVLADDLASCFHRPAWNISFHISMDASWLIGADTFDGNRVVFRPGPVWLCAKEGGFGILDEVNMARNEALAVLHSALDHRRMIDVPGYEKIDVHPAARFIGTMNYGYAGTRDLNEALSSRFVILQMPTISETDLERLLAARFPGMKGKIRSQFVRLFLEINKKAESAEISERALDLRGLLDAIALTEKGIKAGDALEMCVVNKTFDKYEHSLIRDVIGARIPADLGRNEIFG
ncbi:MAG: MoxR family ATPase [Stomatobaculum sp.]|nr:MoxR family ATPase [Stomatobaculum sp.]